MKTCRTCKHLTSQPADAYSVVVSTCEEISSHLTFEISSGWDGHCLERVDVDEPDKFGCTLHEDKDKS